MICPDCKTDGLVVHYMSLPGPMFLDGPICPPREIPYMLFCPHCCNGFFILGNESVEEAYERITHDFARRQRPDCQ